MRLEGTGPVAELEGDLGGNAQHVGAIAHAVGHESHTLEIGYDSKIGCTGKIGVRHDDVVESAPAQYFVSLRDRTIETGPGCDDGVGAEAERPLGNLRIIVHDEDRQVMGRAHDGLGHRSNQLRAFCVRERTSEAQLASVERSKWNDDRGPSGLFGAIRPRFDHGTSLGFAYMRRLRERFDQRGPAGAARIGRDWEGNELFDGWVLPRSDGWSAVGTLGAGTIAHVDEHGRVVPRDRGLSVDFWVGAGDRWWFPSRESNVRQVRVEGMPVVETRLKAGDSDVIFTTWADEPGDGRGRVVVQLSTETEEPVVLAVVVRPFGLRNGGWIDSLRVVDSMVIANGRPLLALTRQPGDVVAGSADIGDVAGRLADMLVGDERVDVADGTATLAVMMPVVRGSDQIVEIVDGRDRASVAPAPLDRTLAGWKLHLEGATTVALPGWPTHLWPSLSSGVLASTVDMSGPAAGESHAPLIRAIVCSALGTLGLTWAAGAILEQMLVDVEGGSIPTADWFAVAASCGRYVATGSDVSILERHRDAVARVVGEGLTSGCGTDQFDELVRAVRLVAGERAGIDASQIVPGAIDLGRARSLALLGVELGSGQWSKLAGFDPTGARIDDVADLSFALIASARLGRDLEAGSAELATDPLVDLRRLAGATWSWRLDRDADSASARGMLIAAIRALVIYECADSIDLLPGFNSRWLGRPIDVVGLPTRWGPLSYSIRWHGARPALLWEVPTPVDVSTFRLGCRRLDPSFSTTDPSGETLLHAPAWATGGR